MQMTGTLMQGMTMSNPERQSAECTICHEDRPDYVFLPNGDIACERCLTKQDYPFGWICPICKKEFKETRPFDWSLCEDCWNKEVDRRNAEIIKNGHE